MGDRRVLLLGGGIDQLAGTGALASCGVTLERDPGTDGHDWATWFAVRRPSLVIVAPGAGPEGLDEVAGALGALSRAGVSTPLVVIERGYDPGRALLCFQMGAEDYLAVAEHEAQLAGVIARLTGSAAVNEPVGETAGETAAWVSAGAWDESTSVLVG